MSDRSEHIVSQVQALWQGALGQVGDRAGEVVRQVSARLEHEKSRPHNGWLDRALKTSARIVDGDLLPLPSRVRRALGQIYHVIDTRVAAQSSSPRASSPGSRSRAPSQTQPRSVRAQPQADAQSSDEETKRVRPPRKRRPRRREKVVEN